MCLQNKVFIFIPLLLLSSSLGAKPPENPPPIIVDAFVVNDEANPVPVDVQNGEANPIIVNVQEDESVPFLIRASSTVDAISTGISQGGFSTNPFDLGRIPEGYRMVLTDASLEVCADDTYNYPPGTKWDFGMNVSYEIFDEVTVGDLMLGSTPTSLVGPTLNFACVVVGTATAHSLNTMLNEGLTLTYNVSRNYTGADEDFRIHIFAVLEPLPVP